MGDEGFGPAALGYRAAGRGPQRGLESAVACVAHVHAHRGALPVLPGLFPGSRRARHGRGTGIDREHLRLRPPPRIVAKLGNNFGRVALAETGQREEDLAVRMGVEQDLDPSLDRLDLVVEKAQLSDEVKRFIPARESEVVVGFGAGLVDSRTKIPTIILVLAFSTIIMLIVDLERPRQQLFKLTQEPMTEVARRIQSAQPIGE